MTTKSDEPKTIHAPPGSLLHEASERASALITSLMELYAVSYTGERDSLKLPGVLVLVYDPYAESNSACTNIQSQEGLLELIDLFRARVESGEHAASREAAETIQ